MWPLFTAIALAPIIGLVAWWVSMLDRLDPEALAKVGVARGWSVRPTRDDDEEVVTLAPADGAWTIRVSRRIPRGGQSTKVSRSGGLRTVWQAAVPCPRGVLAIRPGEGPKGQLAPSPDMLAWLFARAIEEMTGATMEELGGLDHLARIDSGDAGFDDGFVAVGTNPAFAAFLATPAQRRAVEAACATGAAVILSPAGMRLAVAGKALSDGAKLDAMVAAGERLRAAWEGAHASA